ncbi:MAG TPA: VTT domain-containing protein [Bryobacteraceae bacterium]|nr:VTT domain-containing protein [Bryobacteraceae bacterium]
MGLPVVGGVDILLVTISARDPHVAFLAALCAIAGSLIGSIILFGIARKGGEVLLAKHISSRKGARLHAWFECYGLITVFIPALSPIPLPLKIPVICAGALEVRWSRFIAVIASARAIRYFGLAVLGRVYGQAAARFITQHWLLLTVIALGLAALGFVLLRIVRRKSTSTTEPCAHNGSVR